MFDKKTNTIDSKKKVFVVHGRNNTIKLDVARTIEKLDLNAIILHEQIGNSLTIIEKLENYSDVDFAVVILSDDDLGKFKEAEELNPRARQNVIAEMGFFIGKLGRRNVSILYMKGVEIPSDFGGVEYVLIDEAGNWKINLVRDLKGAGFDVDANKLIM